MEDREPPTPKKGDSYSQSFEDFWEIYPKKVGKKAAWSSWKRNKMNGNAAKAIAAVKAQEKTDQWKKGYIPNPSTWINQGRIDDQIETPVHQKSPKCIRCGSEMRGGSVHTNHGDVCSSCYFS